MDGVFSMHCTGTIRALSMSDWKRNQLEIRDMTHAQDLSLAAPSCRSVPFVAIRQSLPSRISFISPFVHQLMQFISRFRQADENNVEIEVALREALANAIVHGNQEDPGKCVRVKCRCSFDGEVSINIEDEGRGFRNDAVPDPTCPANLLLSHGRGIYLMKTLMDEVNFEQGGSVVHMRKRATAANETAPSLSRKSGEMAEQTI
jgi:serine/threonine-protein kinase RsbW